jgi:2-keto-3-deoxy-L-rhamnonate aldolase RhmA
VSSQGPPPSSERDPLLAIHATTADPDVVEMSAAVGARLYIVDLEHGTSSDRGCAGAVRAGDAAGIPVACRLTSTTLGRAGRLLDAGAAGVIVADVRTAGECAAAAAALFHPPLGRRGSGAHRSNAYGLGGTGPSPAAAPARGVRVPLLGVQIESTEGLSNLSEILDAAPLQMVSVGTRDLAVALGHPGDPTHPDVAAAVRRVADAAHRRATPFAQMVRALEQVADARALAPEWVVLPLAAVLRVGVDAFLDAFGGS